MISARRHHAPAVEQASSPAGAGGVPPPASPGGTSGEPAGEDAGATFPRGTRPFQFERDTFAFPNELLWQYHFDAATGAMTTFRTQPPPTYAHRCFVMVRTARQFLYHARFQPGRPAADGETCRCLVREVVSRSPRKASPEADRVIIPGCDNLRSFSQAQEALLKAECGGAWQSYALRSHWRMVFPIWRRHQERVAGQLVRAFRENPAPIVHLFRFPQLTINHGLLLFGFDETDSGVQFHAYDPNIPAHPVELLYQRADRTFYFPRTHYWPGGRLSVVEVYRGWIY
jgi:hypothetical protein